MLVYRKNWMRFFAADKATAGPGSQQGGAVTDDGTATVQDPFAGIDLDDLDEGTRKTIQDAQAKFATLQKEAEETKRIALATEKQAREWQGRYDKMQADIKKAGGGADAQQDKQNALLTQMEQTMIKRGVSPEQAKIQAPMMMEMMESYGTSLREQIGRELAPMAGSVMQQEATNAWNEALSKDKLGALQNPEIAKQVWANVQSLINTGQPITAAVVTNLRNMAWAEHVETNGVPPTTQPMPNYSQPPQLPNFGGGGYPGAGVNPYQPAIVDPNAPRTQVNSDTHAALAATFARMGSIKPSAFGGKRK